MVINYLLMAMVGAAANDGAALPPSATSVPLSTLVGAENARKDWHDDFEEAVQEAARLGLPMVAHFHAKWCGPCQQMEEKVLHTTEVTKVLGLRVVGVKIDVDHNPDLITRFNVEALPTDIYIASDGRIADRKNGYSGVSTWLARLDGMEVATAGVVAGINAGVKQGPLEHQPGGTLDRKDEPVQCVVKKHDGVIVGLGGFSPVALARNKTWEAGDPEFAVFHRGINYYLTNEEEYRTFKADPAKYAPKLLGCDPVVLASQDRVLPGNIELGAYFDGGIYFFASKTSRHLFKKNPREYLEATPRDAGHLELDELVIQVQ